MEDQPLRHDGIAAIHAWAVANAGNNRKPAGRARGAARVLPDLYLGNAQSAADAATLDNLRISAVCSVGPRSEKGPSKI